MTVAEEGQYRLGNEGDQHEPYRVIKKQKRNGLEYVILQPVNDDDETLITSWRPIKTLKRNGWEVVKGSRKNETRISSGGRRKKRRRKKRTKRRK